MLSQPSANTLRSDLLTDVYLYGGHGYNDTSPGHGVDFTSYSMLLEKFNDPIVKQAMHLATFKVFQGEELLSLQPLPGRRTILLFPGGYCSEWDRDLVPEVVKRINDLIHNGCDYVGICAGAYFACKEVRYGSIHRSRSLSFFNGSGVGPLLPSTIKPYASPSILPSEFRYDHTGPHPLDVIMCRWDDLGSGKKNSTLPSNLASPFAATIAGGGYFEGGSSEGTILRYVNTEPSKNRAAVRLPIGLGTATLCFPHVEWPPDLFINTHRAMLEKLNEVMMARFEHWKGLMTSFRPFDVMSLNNDLSLNPIFSEKVAQPQKQIIGEMSSANKVWLEEVARLETAVKRAREYSPSGNQAFLKLFDTQS